jgi:drug/metabolite transporter (DMT)-like permease
MWGIANNLQRVATQRFSAVFVSKFTNLIGGAILILFIPVAQASIVVPLSAFPYLIALVLNIVITTILFNVALGKIGAIRTILIFSTTSVFGSVFAMVFLSERISLIQIMGGAIILLGAYLIQRNEPRLDSSGQLTTT